MKRVKEVGEKQICHMCKTDHISPVIMLECPCGRQFCPSCEFETMPESDGSVIRCPGCKQVVLLPHAPDQTQETGTS